jgi:2Fe-2S ferredoxin
MTITTYRIEFESMGKTIDVNPTELPYQRDGKPGSILDIALGHDIELDHACGGVNACSTCHVHISEGFDSCGETSDAEEDMLDNAPGVTEFSRLACQAVPDGSRNIVVQIPGWNRNHVQESPH